MRQPLQILLDAIPDAALQPLVLELLQNGAPPTIPVAGADGHKPASSTTPTPPAKNRGGRPKGSLNKTTAGETGAKAAARLAALPGREQIVRDVAQGKLTRSAASRQLGTTPRTIANWVDRFRSKQQQEPAATAEAPAAPGRPPGPVGETGPANCATGTARRPPARAGR
jgi:hypothetical protein